MSELIIKQYRKKWFLFAGKQKLTQGFATPEAVKIHYDENKTMIDYWAGSAGVSVSNSDPVIRWLL